MILEILLAATLHWTNPCFQSDTTEAGGCAPPRIDGCAHCSAWPAAPLTNLAAVRIYSVNPGAVPAGTTWSAMLASDSLWALYWPQVRADAQPKLWARLLRAASMACLPDSATGAPPGFYFVQVESAGGKVSCASNVWSLP